MVENQMEWEMEIGTRQSKQNKTKRTSRVLHAQDGTTSKGNGVVGNRKVGLIRNMRLRWDYQTI